MPMGVLCADPKSRSSRLLRPTPRHWRHPPSSSPRPRQPPGRHPARLPTSPKPLRRTQSLGTPPKQPRQSGRLTLTNLGCLAGGGVGHGAVQGISAVSVVPWWSPLVMRNRPPSASTRSLSPMSPDPPLGLAPPTPSFLTERRGYSAAGRAATTRPSQHHEWLCGRAVLIGGPQLIAASVGCTNHRSTYHRDGQ